MEQRRVGRSGLDVSRLGLGTMTWGRDTDADDAAAQLEAFVGAGGTLIDTVQRVTATARPKPIVGTLVPDVVPRSDVVLATTHGRGRRWRAAGCSTRWTRRCAGSAPTTSTSGRCTASTRPCRSRRPAPRCEPRSHSGRARYVGLSGFPAGNWPPPPTWQRAAGTARWSRRRPSTRWWSATPEESACCRRRRRAGHRGARLGPARPRGADRQVPARHAGRLPGRLPAFRPVRRPAPRRARARIVEAVATAAEGLGTSPLAVAWPGCGTGRASRRAVVGARDAAQLLGSLAAEELAAARRDPRRPRRRQRGPDASRTTPRSCDAGRRSVAARPGCATSSPSSAASGLWPGVGPARGCRPCRGGHPCAGAGDAPRRCPACPRCTDRRADRLYTAWIGAGAQLTGGRTAGAAGSAGPLGGPAGRRARRRRRRVSCAPIRGGCWCFPTRPWRRPTGSPVHRTRRARATIRAAAARWSTGRWPGSPARGTPSPPVDAGRRRGPAIRRRRRCWPSAARCWSAW